MKNNNLKSKQFKDVDTTQKDVQMKKIADQR